MNAMDKEVLVASELADWLRVDKQRVYELCRTDPTFPFILVGQRQYRFSRQAIHQWLENGGSNKGGQENDI